MVDELCQWKHCTTKPKWSATMRGQEFRVCAKHLEPTCVEFMADVQRDAITVLPIFMNW